MKTLIVGDVHWSQYTSIIRSRGEYYSKRLENCIRSLIWVQEEAIKRQVDSIVYLGDFFDKPDLNSEEISALSEIEWAPCEQIFLVGNHESIKANLIYSSAHIFNNICGARARIITEPCFDTYSNIKFLYLPYIVELDRKPLQEYMQKSTGEEVRYIFSHNDIKGVNYGHFISKEGFDIQEIMNNCNYYFNGHLHNAWEYENTIINVGNLTGQNFNEDAFCYDHRIMYLDTDLNKLETLLNPRALYFAKADILTSKDLDALILKINNKFSSTQNEIALSIRGQEILIPTIRAALAQIPNVSDYRLTTIFEATGESIAFEKDIKVVDHLQQFKEWMLNTFTSSDIIISELEAIINAN